MAERILVADDDPKITDLIEIYLKNENYHVCKCNSAGEVLRAVDEQPFDLAILDIMTPEMDGFAICRHIREKNTYPIIMLTANGGETDTITGFAMGADDYIVKPFRPLELVARVKAQIRRSKRYNTATIQTLTPTTLYYKDLMLDTDQHLCTVSGNPIVLTRKEFAVLELLMRNRGKVVTTEEMLRRIWQYEYFSKNNNTINVHIRRLREKLQDNAEQPKYIRTVWGIGYKIDAE